MPDVFNPGSHLQQEHLQQCGCERLGTNPGLLAHFRPALPRKKIKKKTVDCNQIKT